MLRRQYIWTHPYEPPLAHSHRQQSPTQATTQEFLVFIHHPEPQLMRCHSEPQLKECDVLNPYPKPQLKGYVPSHNSRNTTKPTFEISPKSRKPHTIQSKKNTSLASALSLGAALRLPGETRFQTACGEHVPPSVKCLGFLCLQVSPGRTSPIAKRHSLPSPL